MKRGKPANSKIQPKVKEYNIYIPEIEYLTELKSYIFLWTFAPVSRWDLWLQFCIRNEDPTWKYGGVMHTLRQHYSYVTTFNKKQSQCFVCLCACVREREIPQRPMNQKIFQWPQMWHQPSLVSCVVFPHTHVLTRWRKMPRADAMRYLSTPTWKQVTQAQMTEPSEGKPEC